MKQTDHPPYALARLADCADPDSPESPGALFLMSVQDACNEIDDPTDDDALHEIADAAPDVYTHARWLEFVDLCAYTEEPELGSWDDDLTNAAGIALYQIAHRLAAALLEERAEDDDDEVEEEDD